MVKNTKGFSLVEMAIVLIILGLILTSISSVFSMFVNIGAAERTRERINANKEALISIAAADGYLHKTAVGALAANVELSYPVDVFNRNFHTVVAPELSVTVAKVNLDYSPVCGTLSTSYSLNICNDDTCSAPSVVSNIAFAIISGYEDRNIQTDVVTNVINIYTQGDAEDDYTTDVDNAVDYDDIVSWVTLPELRAKAGCDSERLKFADTTLPSITSDATAINIYAEGGIPYVDAVDDTLEEYRFEVIDDGGTASPAIVFSVVNGAVPSAIAEGDSPIQGEYFRVNGNASALTTGTYRIIINVRDESGNQNQRTLYLSAD